GDRIRAAEDLRELVRPACVPDRAIDGSVDLVAPRARGLEIRGPGFHHLGEAVQDLAAVVGRHPGPGRERRAGGAHRVAGVLARRARDVVLLGLERPTGLGARKRATDVELVGLLDRETAHWATSVAQ